MRSFSLLTALVVVGSLAPACASTDAATRSDADVSAAPGTLLIENATLVDPATRKSYVGTVAIAEGKIKGILAPGTPHHGAAKVVDGTGKYVLPGLTDLHTHLFFGNPSPHGYEDPASQDSATQTQLGNRYLYAGVTTYLDLFAPNDAGDDPAQTLGADLNIFALRGKERTGGFVHPRSFVAGPLFLVPGSHGIEGFAAGDVIQIKVKDDAGARLSPDKLADVAKSAGARVASLIDTRHPDVIKFVFDNHEDMPSDRPEKMPIVIAKAIIDAANARQVKTVAHVGTWKGVEELANAGVSAFTHLPSGAAPPSTLAALRSHDVAAITTVSIYSDYGDMEERRTRDAFVDDLAATTLAPDGLTSAYRNYSGYADVEKGWVAWGHRHNEADDQGKAIRSLIAGGVRILAGTDSGNTGALYGFSLARELMQLEKAGMPMWDVLRSSTSEAQRFLGQKRGVLAAGYDADLVVLDADPVAHASNLRRVSSVVLRGVVIDRAALDR